MVKIRYISAFCKYSFFFSVLLFLFACNRQEEHVDSPVTIHLFKSDNSAISAPIEKDDENGWLPLLNVDLSQSDFVINESDMDSYDWKYQIISLNSDVVERFEYRTIADTDLDVFVYSYFILALGEESVVGGIILPEVSAVGSWIPVLYISHKIEFPETELENAKLEMVLRQHSYLHVEAETSFMDDLNDKVRMRLLQIGKLIE